MKKKAIIIGTGLLFGVLLLGLWLIQQGLDDVFLILGDDLAIPGDRVGELDIQQMRRLSINGAALLQILAGFALITGTWIGLERLNARFKKPF